MNLSEKQITLIYPEAHNLGKQAYAHAVNQNIPIYHLDPVKTPFTGTDILQLSELLQLPITDMLNTNNPIYQNEYKTANFGRRDWIHILQHNPEMLKMPIAVRGRKAKILNSPADVSHL